MLTDDEIKLVVETCIVLSNIDLGIDEDTFLQVCNEIVTQTLEKIFHTRNKGSCCTQNKKKQGLI